jgi:hypothetical protein
MGTVRRSPPTGLVIAENRVRKANRALFSTDPPCSPVRLFHTSCKKRSVKFPFELPTTVPSNPAPTLGLSRGGI